MKIKAKVQDQIHNTQVKNKLWFRLLASPISIVQIWELQEKREREREGFSED